MVKALAVYESRYGNTKLVAEAIAEGITEDPDNQASVHELKEIDINQLPDFDVILIGSPNHIGGPLGSIKRFINELGKLDVKEKYAAAFDTYMMSDHEKAMKKIEQQIHKKAPALKLITPGLSIRVKGFKGPVSEGELPKCKEFGIKLAKR